MLDQLQALPLKEPDGRPRAKPPTAIELADWASQNCPPGKRPPSKTTINDWIKAKHVPATFDDLWMVVKGVQERRLSTRQDPRCPPRAVWESSYKKAGAEREAEARAEKAAKAEAAQLAQERAARRRRGEYAFQGLAPYTTAQADRFFGRETETADLLARLDRSYRGSAPNPVFLAGPSGAGKSSFLRAGVAAQLQTSGLASNPGVKDWPVMIITPGERPLDSLVTGVPALREHAMSTHIDIEAVQAAVMRGYPAGGVVLMVDQAEELFQDRITATDRNRFAELLAAMAASATGGHARALIIIGVRDDQHYLFRDVPATSGARRTQEEINHFTESQLRTAITGAAAEVGLEMPPELVERIVADAHLASRETVDGLLPLISHVLRLMEEKGTFSLAIYENLKGLTGAIRTTADAVWDRVVAEGLTQVGMTVLLQLVLPGASPDKDRSRPVRRSDLVTGHRSAAVAAVLATLDQARLITTRVVGEDPNDDAQVEVALIHETLLRAWPLLAEAIEDQRDAIAACQQTEAQAEQWENEGEPAGSLYRSPRLEAAEQAAASHTVTDRARRFLTASAKQSRRATLTRRAAIGSLSALTLTALGSTIGFANSSNQARAERDTANTAQINSVAKRLRETDVSAAALLTLASYRRQATPPVAVSIMGFQQSALSSRGTGHRGAANAVVWVPRRQALITSSDDHLIRIWSLTPQGIVLRSTLYGHTDVVIRMAISPDGNTLASASEDETVQLADIGDLDRPRQIGQPLRGHIGQVICVSWSADGTMLASGGHDEKLRVWDVSNLLQPRLIAQLVPGGGGDCDDVSWHPTQHLLGTSDDSGWVSVWDFTDPRRPTQLAKLAGHVGNVISLFWSPDGRTIASGGEDGTVRLWDVTTPANARPLAVLHGHHGKVFDVGWSPDSRLLASAGRDRTIHTWNVIDPPNPIPFNEPMYGHSNIVYSVDWSADGQLSSASEDRSVRVWDVPKTFLGHTGAVTGLALSGDQRILVSVSADDTLRTWRLETGESNRELHRVDKAGIRALALNPGGRLFTADSGGAMLWNLTSAGSTEPIAELPGAKGVATTSVATSPDGRLLAAGYDDGSVRIWRVTGSTSPAPALMLQAHTETVQALRFSPDSQSLASGSSDKTVVIYTTRGPGPPTRRNILSGHNRPVTAFAWQPDSRTLASASLDQTIILWDAPTARLITQLRGHGDDVLSVDFSHDGRFLVSGGADHTIRVWDTTVVPRAAQIGYDGMPGHTDDVTAVLLSPGNNLMFSAGADRTIRRWSTEPKQSIMRICRSTRGALTAAEWDSYLGGVPYAPPCPASPSR
jgi:WD40 repeat protein